MSSLHPDSCLSLASGSGTQRTRRKSSVTVMGRDRKLSQDVTRKLSAISTAPDISALSDRLGMDQEHLKTIVKDILDMDDNNKWQAEDCEDNASDYGPDDEGWETDEQIYETVRIDQKKKDSTSSQSSDGSPGPIDINVEEFNTVLNIYMRHQISITSFVHHEKNVR